MLWLMHNDGLNKNERAPIIAPSIIRETSNTLSVKVQQFIANITG
jgi:hypothetical protein